MIENFKDDVPGDDGKPTFYSDMSSLECPFRGCRLLLTYRCASIMSGDEHWEKLYGLTISSERLEDIRRARRPGSRYAAPPQVSYEVRQAEALFARYGIPHVDTTRCSIEEIASRILDRTGLQRRVLP